MDYQNPSLADLYASLPPSVHNPYDASPGDPAALQALKLKYAQQQVFGQPIYPPEMQRQPIQQPAQAQGLGELLMQLLGGR